VTVRWRGSGSGARGQRSFASVWCASALIAATARALREACRRAVAVLNALAAGAAHRALGPGRALLLAATARAIEVALRADGAGLFAVAAVAHERAVAGCAAGLLALAARALAVAGLAVATGLTTASPRAVERAWRRRGGGSAIDDYGNRGLGGGGAGLRGRGGGEGTGVTTARRVAMRLELEV